MASLITVLFIHGTGTREAGYQTSLAEIRQGLGTVCPEVRLEGYYWGGPLGTALHLGGASVPDYKTTRSLAEPDFEEESGSQDSAAEGEVRALVWEQLERDPFYEFRRFAGATEADVWVRGTTTPSSAACAALVEDLALTASGKELGRRLDQAGLRRDFSAAAATVAGMDFVASACAVEDPADESPRVAGRLPALARATFAVLLFREAGTEAAEAALDALAADAGRRDEWAGLLAEHLLDRVYPPNQRSLVGFARHAFDDLVTQPFLWAAGHVGTWKARRQRHSLMDHASPVAGDILWYQAHGAGLRREIARLAEGYAVAGPVVLVAHSLGGIACVDTLNLLAPRGVKLLITAGSQTSFLYEIGALVTRPLPPPPRPPLPHRLPDTFPHWLNFYDPRDLLSYWVQPIFSTPGAVESPADHRLDNGFSFPGSHSGYWRNPELWKIAGPAIQKLS